VESFRLPRLEKTSCSRYALSLSTESEGGGVDVKKFQARSEIMEKALLANRGKSEVLMSIIKRADLEMTDISGKNQRLASQIESLEKTLFELEQEQKQEQELSVSAGGKLLERIVQQQEELKEAHELMAAMEDQYTTEIEQLKEFIDTSREQQRIDAIQFQSLVENARKETVEVLEELKEKEQELVVIVQELASIEENVETNRLKLKREKEEKEEKMSFEVESDTDTERRYTYTSERDSGGSAAWVDGVRVQVDEQRKTITDYLIAGDLRDQKRLLEVSLDI